MMLLLILIATAWLAVLTLFVAVCRTAADGERPRGSLDQLSSVAIGPKLVLSKAPERPRPLRRTHGTPSGPRPVARRMRASHGVR
jgi:hypothetical protein